MVQHAQSISNLLLLHTACLALLATPTERLLLCKQSVKLFLHSIGKIATLKIFPKEIGKYNILYTFVVVQFCPWLKFYFPLFLCMVMYEKDIETKGKVIKFNHNAFYSQGVESYITHTVESLHNLPPFWQSGEWPLSGPEQSMIYWAKLQNTRPLICMWVVCIVICRRRQ